MLDETSFTAEKHWKFIKSVIKHYNLLLAHLFKKPLLGCISHRLYIAVEHYLQAKLKEGVDCVAKLMLKLSTKWTIIGLFEDAVIIESS